MKVIALKNKDFVGDNNQIQGVLEALQSLSIEPIDITSMEEADLVLSELDPNALILASGSHGLKWASDIKQYNKNIKIVWSGHQFFDEFNHLSHWPSIVALPETAVSQKQAALVHKNATLELTKGVAHCVNDKTVKADAERFQGALPYVTEETTCLGIILAGDAPTTSGEMRCFGPDDAVKQAQHIAHHIKSNLLWHDQTVIMVTNGPRTGKHDPITKQPYDPDPHRSHTLDASSKAFLEELGRQLEIDTDKIYFYDFQFDALKTGPSAYKPMMHVLARSQKSYWYVPCESTSMVTESTHLSAKGVEVIVYHPQSENATHLTHAADYVSQGIVSDIHTPRVEQRAVITMTSAANQIAQRSLLLMTSNVQEYYQAPSSTFFGGSMRRGGGAASSGDYPAGMKPS